MPGVIQIRLAQRRTYRDPAPSTQCTGLYLRTQTQPGGHRLQGPPAAPAGQEPEGPACHSDHLPLHLPRLPEREVPTRTVSHCSFSQSIIHTSICWLALREKKEKSHGDLKGRGRRGKRKPGFLSCAGCRGRPLDAHSEELPAFAL